MSHLLAVLTDDTGLSPRPQLLPAEDAAVHAIPQHAAAHVLQPGHQAPGTAQGMAGEARNGTGNARNGTGNARKMPGYRGRSHCSIPAEPLLFQLRDKATSQQDIKLPQADTAQYPLPGMLPES